MARVGIDKEAQDGWETPRTPRAKVLVVEDNRVNQKVVLAQLGKLNCEAELAANGSIALDMLQRRTFQMVLMDLAMPVMDGYQCTEHIRALEGEYYKTLPIVAITASLTENEKDKCMAAGMSDFLSKPVRLNQLHEVLTRWCN